MDDLVDSLASSFAVSNNPNDPSRPHPRFSLYKGRNEVGAGLISARALHIFKNFTSISKHFLLLSLSSEYKEQRGTLLFLSCNISIVMFWYRFSFQFSNFFLSILFLTSQAQTDLEEEPSCAQNVIFNYVANHIPIVYYFGAHVLQGNQKILCQPLYIPSLGIFLSNFSSDREYKVSSSRKYVILIINLNISNFAGPVIAGDKAKKNPRNSEKAKRWLHERR